MRSITILILVICSVVLPQGSKYSKINYHEVERDIQDSTSAVYYPKLMDRYNNGDTTLSLNDYRHLYYGYSFQSRYDPWWKSDHIDVLKPIYAKPSLSQSDCDTIIKYATQSISEFPFDIRQINMLGYAYHLKGNDSLGVMWARKVQGIFGAILSTGDGRSCATGFNVISVAHEYDILRAFELEMTMQALSNDSHCDYITVKNRNQETDFIYFDIWRTLQVKMKDFKK